jgi:hypothetical protein
MYSDVDDLGVGSAASEALSRSDRMFLISLKSGG